MKLRQLFEAHHKADAAFCFGRFNPPHQGHMQVWNAVKHAGRHWFIGTNPGTIGPNDPLPYDLKTAWMTAIDPTIKGHILGEQSVVTLAAKIYQQVGDGATVAYVTDDQDWAWAGKLLHQYNGKESNHGYFNFAKIIHVPSPRVSSATALRTAARAGDMNAFYQAAGTDPNLAVNGKHYYDTVVDAVGQHPEKIKKVKKEKPVAEPIEQESLMGFMAKPVKKKSTTSAEEMRKYFEKEKAKEPPVYKDPSDDKNVKAVFKRQADENSIKYANRMIREMRAHQFIKESGTHEIDATHKAAIKNATTFPDQNPSTGSSYLNWRFGIALAGAPDYPTKQSADNWIGGDPLLSPYTEQENEMINAAAKQVGDGTRQTWSNNRSLETVDTNKTSAVAKPKKNKYGV